MPKEESQGAQAGLSEDPQDPTLNDDNLRKEISDRYKYCTSHVKEWDKVAKEDMAFGLGDQWTPEELSILKEQARPAMTFNRIKPIINIVSGYQRENSSRIKVSPEGGEDKVFSEVIDRVMKYVDKISHLGYKMSYWFDDGLYVGKGWLEAVLTFENDPIKGELRFLQRTPYQILIDPDFNEYDLNEWPRAQYLFKVVRLTRQTLKELYPAKTTLIDGFVNDTDDIIANGSGLIGQEGGKDDYGNRPNKGSAANRTNTPDEESGLTRDNKFTVKEYWRPKMVKRYFVIDRETSEPRKFETKEQADAFAAAQNAQVQQPAAVMAQPAAQPPPPLQAPPEQPIVSEEPGSDTPESGVEAAPEQPMQPPAAAPVAPAEPAQLFKVISRDVPEIWVATSVCGFTIQDIRSPFEPFYSGYPFFRFLADWTPSAESEELKVQGVVRALKDPQREKNKAKSQNLHILNTQANSGWIGDEESLTAEGWKKLEKMGSKPGITVQKKKGYELREILPKGPNAGHIRREQDADQEFKQISAVNPDLMGMQEGTSSGKAISLRIRQAVLALVRVFHNYRYSKEVIGGFILQMIPAMFDEKKMMKIIGPQYARMATDPQLYPQGLTEGHLKAFLIMIKDNKYDVLVSEADSNKTIRYEIFQDLLELAKIRPEVPVELLIDYMDISNSEEVKKKVQEARQQAMAMAAAQQKKP